ncbi:MAG: hypothetical protein FDZ69_10220 [Deltaproteobacteria bacterium]|nr:MAG: hypothetical protein FDZ69_10220 [Deltaproteobacteria bacterium]
MRKAERIGNENTIEIAGAEPAQGALVGNPDLVSLHERNAEARRLLALELVARGLTFAAAARLVKFPRNE